MKKLSAELQDTIDKIDEINRGMELAISILKGDQQLSPFVTKRMMNKLFDDVKGDKK